MQYGAMNFPIKPVDQELEDIAALGFDYLELTMDPPQAHYTTIRQQMNSILSALNSHAMNVICHLTTFVSTADLQEMFNSLEVAAELGSLKVVLHPGHIGGLGVYVKETALAYANESLASIINRAQDLGLCVCLENMFRTPVMPTSAVRAVNVFLILSNNSANASVISTSVIISENATIIYRWAPAKSIFQKSLRP
jgi:sugar phosphate isomerase/epimerase